MKFHQHLAKLKGVEKTIDVNSSLFNEHFLCDSMTDNKIVLVVHCGIPFVFTAQIVANETQWRRGYGLNPLKFLKIF